MSNKTVASRPRRILIVASNAAVSPVTGWPVGFWWAELTHPYWAFAQAGYQLDIASPQGGDLRADAYSDPEDESGYSAEDILSLGFKRSPSHSALLQRTRALAEVDPDDYDAVFVVGGQGPMVTMIDDEALHAWIARFHSTGKITALVCHATCILLRARGDDGKLLAEGKTWTGFANVEEQFADEAVGRRIQPFRIEDEARKLQNSNFIVQGRFTPFAVRDGNLVTGQQQHSGALAAKLVIEALGA